MDDINKIISFEEVKEIKEIRSVGGNKKCVGIITKDNEIIPITEPMPDMDVNIYISELIKMISCVPDWSTILTCDGKEWCVDLE